MTNTILHPVVSRRRLALRAVATSSALVIVLAGYLSGVLTPVSPASAACGIAFSNCGADTTVTAAVLVTHGVLLDEDPPTLDPVEPNTSDTWQITPTWSTSQFEAGCACVNITPVTVQGVVSWSESTAWSVACTGCAAGGVVSLSICTPYGCGSAGSMTNSYGYKLIADVAHTRAATSCSMSRNHHLTNVNFTTSAVNNGNVIDLINCTEGAAVSPTSQVWSVDDTGTFECSFDCSQSGVLITILYQ